MANYDWLKEIDFEKYLTEDMKKLLELVGLDVFIKLVERYKGRSLYITSDPFRGAKPIYVLKNFDGKNVKKIARDLGVTTKTIYIYVKEHREKTRDKKQRH